MNRSRMLILALAALLACGTLFTITPVHAATFTVTRTDDPPPNDCKPNDCSLREAIIAANVSAGPDTITLPDDTFTLLIANASADENPATGDLDITSNITLTGAGATNTIIQAGTTSGNGIDRVFEVSSSGTLSLSGVTVRNGRLSGSRSGGGIFNAGTLTITNSSISGNTITYYGGGIHNAGTLTIANSTISGNSADDAGGGISNAGTLTITNSIISGNTPTYYGGGIRNYSGTLTITNSTISGNAAVYSGGGIYNASGTLTITNSTISGNAASFLASGGGISNAGTLTLANSTISGNTVDGKGGGISNGGTLMLKNTLIGNNTKVASTTKDDCAGTLTSQGYNLIESSDGCTITGDATGNIIGSDPLLGALANNGGSTQTQALLPNSPAIDAGDPAGCTDAQGQPLATDQRGVARPQGARCDIGAFELEMAAPPTPTPSPEPTPTPTPEPTPVPEPSSSSVFLPVMVK